MTAMRALLAFAFCLAAVPTARADRAAGATAVAPDELEAVVGEEEIAGGMSRRRVPPTPAPPLTTEVLEDTLRAAQSDMEACLGGRGSASVRARVGRDGALTLRVRLRPADDVTEACIDTAARRRLLPLLSIHTIRRAVSATVRIGRRGSTPPVPPPPGPGPGTVDEAIVHARLDVATSALMRCLADAAPGVVGTVTLSVHARSDGALVLEGVSMPPGVTAGPALVCMGDVVSRVRVPEGGGDRDVSHPIALGR